MTSGVQMRPNLKVGVLRGGPSHEYEVSLQSGSQILRSLRDRFQMVDIVITRDGLWHVEGRVRGPEKILPQLDVAFNALHGSFGEDGKIQTILEQYMIPYTGSRPIPSALSLNKILTQKHLSSKDIRMPVSTSISHAEHTRGMIRELFRLFPQPSIIKPAIGGSSLGVSVAYTFDEFEMGIEKALRFSPVAIVEEFIPGTEVTCTVIDGFGGKKGYALSPHRIQTKDGELYFSYEMKCDPATKSCIVPADLPSEIILDIQKTALRAHQSLGLRHYSTSDFIVSPRRGVYLIEVNSLPGLSDHSALPMSLSHAGIGMSDFFVHVVEMVAK
jgi:D-alanine-D-alanine ligase